MARENAIRLSPDEIGQLFREGSGRAVATLIRIFGDIDVAEDAVQDAFVIALDTWPSNGPPPNTNAWILQAARHRAIDRLRRESLGRALLSDVIQERSASEPPANDDAELEDDLLRLIFTCCHPALAADAQVALTLRLLGGLATPEVARAFLVEEATMAQRIVRAKRKIKEALIPYRVPAEAELPRRLAPVLAVIYLIYNAGLGRTSKAAEGLSREAIRLARLMHELLPEEPEIAGLLSLLLFSESRRAARCSPDGSLILLRDQKRGAWDSIMIEEARVILRACLARDEAGPYQIQAAIQAVHADVAGVESTDWEQIVALYDELLHMLRTPVVALNRAVAVAEVQGPEAALALVDQLHLPTYHLYYATRADFLRRLRRFEEAVREYENAAELAPTEEERRFLQSRVCAIRSRSDQT